MNARERSDPAAAHVSWPATRFLWSEIDVEALGSRPARRELSYLLETDLPVPLEAVHAVFAPLADDGGGRRGRRFAACAVEIQRLRDELPAGAVSLRPEAPPPFLAGRVDCARLNLLVGPWEPRAVRRLRRTWIATALAAALACLGAVSWGIHRRTAVESDRAVAAERLRREVLGAAIGPAGLQPNADMVLASELSRLRATRRPPPSEDGRAWTGGEGARDGGPDAASILAAVLALWPADVHMRTESVSASEDGVAITGTVPTSADAQKVADALGRIELAPGTPGLPAQSPSPTSWRLDQPRFETRRDGVSVVLRVRREGAGAR